MSARRAAPLLLAALLAACVVGPAYERPSLDVPHAYHHASADQSARSIADLPWWEVFGDAQLLILLEESIRANLDLRIAAAQVREAEAAIAAARAPLFPQLSAQVLASRSNQPPAVSAANSFLGALALSWEIDFWGRYARATEAARAILVATEEGRRAVLASLVSAVAQQYLLLKSLSQRLEVVRRTAEAQRDSLRLVTLLAQHGVQSAAEVRQAEGQLLTTENQMPGIERQIAQAEDALAVLLGKAPQSFQLNAVQPTLALPPQVPAGLPSELIERRPDIRQAEQQLVAANANVGAARARFFPSISLSASLGRVSPVLRDVIDRGRTAGAIQASVLLPLLSGGALQANYETALARVEQAALNYRRTILTALQEVSDSLVALDRDTAESEGNRRRAAVTAEALRLAQLRFRSGVASYIDVLDAQRQLLAAELDLTASEFNQRSAAVQLYRALGGGWDARPAS
jgi:multidrug efflux system outer membrane protein